MSAKGIILTVLVVITLAASGVGVYLIYGGRQAEGLEVELLAPEQIALGEPFTAAVTVANRSKSILEDVDLVFEVPENVVFLGSGEQKRIHQVTLGTIGIGGLHEERFELIVLRDEHTIKELTTSVGYRTPSLQSRFSKEARTTVLISGSSLELDFTLPQKVFSGETFESVVSYKNVAGRDLEDITLTFSYPSLFTYEAASPTPSGDENSWELGDLRSGSEGEVSVEGSIVGPEDAFFEFGVRIDARFSGVSYTIAEQTGGIAIAEAPLSLSVQLSNSAGGAVGPGDQLSYVLSYENNTDIGLKDVVIRAELMGEMFDFSTLASNASLQAFSNTLIWNAANTSGLSLISPGSSGTVSFNVKVREGYPITKLSDKNFILRVAAIIESPTVPYFVAAAKTVSVAEHEVKVRGAITIDAQGYYRDAPSGIVNSGFMPPSVGDTTQFTVHWVLRNFGTDVSSITARAFLGGNVQFTNVVKGSGADFLTHNANTQELVWDVGSVPAGKGVVSFPIEVIFQVAATPSLTQLGKELILLQATTLSAHDEFTGEALSAGDGAVVTNQLDDATVDSSQGIVQP
jgi:hypothetical protein